MSGRCPVSPYRTIVFFRSSDLLSQTQRVDSCGHANDSHLHSEIIGDLAGENKRRVSTIDPRAAQKVRPELMSGELRRSAKMTHLCFLKLSHPRNRIRNRI
jgi:hypothetical protein